ncbi:MAG TPA: hypothetical protein DDY14_11705 [Chromatiaceae bacterium]|nr:MAG: hypothetical protein N838_32655 [Thiohalocapsa sp. PB-PSB1]HBG95951.1 hypothetical protein [Chromatiaceae bacterium]HCS89709.1 hypothetical protein [Chromatiaceae bacterium]
MPESAALQKPILEARLEAICARGCKRVGDDIAALERGHQLAETEGLNARERAWLLAELKAIMAVYGGSCRIEPADRLD